MSTCSAEYLCALIVFEGYSVCKITVVVVDYLRGAMNAYCHLLFYKEKRSVQFSQVLSFSLKM